MTSSQILASAQEFRLLLEYFGPLSNDNWQYFEKKLIHKSFSKNQHLIEQAAVEHYVYFITKGFVRVYAQIDDNAHITNFRFAGELTSSITSFITREASNYTIQALEDVETLAISYSQLEDVYKAYPAFNYIGRRVIEQLYVEKHKREIAFMSMSAEERYRSLLKRKPEFAQHFSVKHIASYLGMQPESLSRIRKNIHG